MDTGTILEAQARRAATPRRTLRVALVCSARNGTYGAVQSMLTLAEELRLQGHDVHMVTFKGRGLGDVARSRGFQVHEIAVRLKVDPFAILSLARVLRQNEIDVVHSHLSTSALIGGLAARIGGVPSLATVHGLSSKGSFITSGHLLAVSNDVRRHLVDQGIRPEKVTVVLNGISITPVATVADRLAARAELGLAPDDRVVGSTVRLTPAKGAHHALAAFGRVAKEVPSARLVLFGDGEARNELERQARDLGVRDMVVFAGYRSDVRALLPALDVFVFPSLKEAMGIAIVEAMLAGLPVVAHDVGGIPEVVTREMGYLVAAGDEHSMAQHLSDLLYEDRLRQRMGQAARDRAVSEFDAVKMGARTVDAYSQAISRHGK